MMDMNKTHRTRRSIANIPVIGYVIRVGWDIVRLPSKIDGLSRRIIAADQSAASLAKNQQALEEITQESRQQLTNVQTTLADIQTRSQKLTDRVLDIKHQILSAHLTKATSKSNTSETANGNELFADDHDLDTFYVEFEDKFRGTESEIKDRLKVYLPYFKELKTDFTKYPVLDIGCGRGELLDLLKENSIRTIGLDLNASMVEQCKARGFEAVQAEALEYLMQQKPGSLSVITGFHIVEHIPFNFLLRLFEASYRALRPGGIIIFETPDPENLHVGSFSFYFDPSHLHPLAPDVLAFAIENRGFDETEILRLHPRGDGHENDNRDDQYIAEVLHRFYMEQDYSVIGYKK
jgi:O-antigen chain-terminating methyltransferase